MSNNIILEDIDGDNIIIQPSAVTDIDLLTNGQGPAGPQGDTGPTGATGAPGPQGPPGTGGLNRITSTVSANTNAGAVAVTDYVYLVSGTTTVTLPTAVSNTNLYTIKNVGSNSVTVATTSSQTIDGSLTASIPVTNTSLDIISDNTNWRII